MHDLYVEWMELKAFLEHLQTSGYVKNSFANDFNMLVQQLSHSTKEDYSQYLLEGSNHTADELFTKGARLLTRINNRQRLGQKDPVFNEHSNPKTPNSPISVNQVNNQEVTTTIMVTIVSEITEQLTRAEAKFAEDSKERSFIDQVKAGVKTVKSIGELMALVLMTGQQLGLDLAQLSSIFNR